MQRRFALAMSAVVLFTIALVFVDAAPATEGVLSRIRATGRITLGYRTDARPFSYTDNSGKAAGYSIALCQRIADETRRQLNLPNLAVKWVPVQVDTRFRALQVGTVDLLCGADTVNFTRRAEVAFSIPIFPGGIGALLRSDSPARLREVLSGRGQSFHPVWRAAATQVLQARDFSVVGGTSADRWLSSAMRQLDVVATVARVNAYDAGVKMLLDRRSDVFFGERAILLDAAKRSSGTQDLVVLDRLFTHEPLAFALPRDDEDFRLLVDRTLARMYRSGEFGTLYAKTFGEPDESALTFFRWNAIPE